MSELAFESFPVGNVLYNLWRRGATREDIEVFGEAIFALERQVNDNVNIFMVIPENTSLPDDSARKLAGEVIGRSRLDRVMIVIEGRGFGAGAMRSVFVGVGSSSSSCRKGSSRGASLGVLTPGIDKKVRKGSSAMTDRMARRG